MNESILYAALALSLINSIYPKSIIKEHAHYHKHGSQVKTLLDLVCTSESISSLTIEFMIQTINGEENIDAEADRVIHVDHSGQFFSTFLADTSE